MAALERAFERADIETRSVTFLQKRHSVVVRTHEAGHPAVAKAPRIEECPQKRFVIPRLERFSRREASRTLCPTRKRGATQVMVNFFERGSRRSYALALYQRNRVIEII